MDELEDIPGVDTAELAAFKTEASEAAAEVEVLPPSPLRRRLLLRRISSWTTTTTRRDGRGR
jgi:hypothetical protein